MHSATEPVRTTPVEFRRLFSDEKTWAAGGVKSLRLVADARVLPLESASSEADSDEFTATLASIILERRQVRANRTSRPWREVRFDLGL